ncbi:MAG: patatin-like phospholipase family protein [Myxococcota bacterium]|nr:patatin-like phospholipase family protein [Myxococcota bacterium]
MADDTSREETALQLQRLESALVDDLFDHPGVLTRKAEHQLRYALSLSALDVFQPGAARRGTRSARPDVRVRLHRLSRFRRKLLDGLVPVLQRHGSSSDRLEAAFRVVSPWLDDVETIRAELIAKYADDFSPVELDQELGIKTLVSIAGGGGGSAYVYIGAWEVLHNAGLVPGYVIGSSMGAVTGLFRSLRRRGDFAEYVAMAKQLRADQIFRFVSLRTRYGLPGVTRLFLHEGLGPFFRTPRGEELRLCDLEIPYSAVVAGIRRDALGETPEQFAISHHLHEDQRPSPLQFRAQIASQLVRVTGFINPRVVKEILIGGDALTREFNALDAAGFSAAVPGVLHYDVTHEDPHMNGILKTLMEREDVTALVDGGAANNVPSRSAWQEVRAGRIGTRNCYYLAFDCFQPQWGPGHVWIQPVTRTLSLQVAGNERYAHQRVEFPRTLSPISLLPRPEDLDRAVAWGRNRMASELPRIQKFFERVRFVPTRRAS